MESTAPPAFLRLAGHPVRWRLLQQLAHSDRMVHELTGLVGEPQNLVSYHLGKLRAARLVSARRSSADGRDTYYTVDLAGFGASLAAAGAALHPALGGRTAGDPPAGARVLFLCTGNSARSPMAEALTRWRSGGRVEAYSAGSHPKPLHPNAVRVLREEYGIDVAGRPPIHLDVFADRRFDRVVTLCDRVREVCPETAGSIHWSIPDPSAEHPDADDHASYPTFKRTAAELESRIGFLLATLTPTTAEEAR